ncbi:hypothetical protein VKT23_016122 [Stygiomarasmius scandens]|uniref:Uncharacterized protein n=1 Tax=Marasmiellus scandens TaxID=2682957 RepID=A0ABR1IY39_9AGAR
MEPFPSSPEDPTSNGKHHKTRSRDLSFSELDPVLREQLKPNAHPYAIRTTSTALLSRSNSQSHRETRHSYVPSSPQRERGHRKGSSSFGGITAAAPGSPRPLPVPPNTTSPTRQPRRAESAAPELAYQFPNNESSWIRHTSTSSASSSSMDLADLPPNPKIWTPSQLSAYLTTALRVRSGVKGDGEQEQEDLKLPVHVAQDIAAFVREKKIKGRVFLRYGINKLWRTALLTSSRNLRQNVQRGRIWGFEDESLPTSPSGLRSPNPNTGSPNVPSLTPIPSVMYTPSAIRPNSNANLGAFEMLANTDTIESPTSTRPTLGHGSVDGLPLSSGLGMGAPFVASVTTGSVQSGETTTEHESAPVFPSNASRYIIPKDGVAVKVAGDTIHDMERDEGQASIYTFNTAGGESPTRSPRGQAALSKDDEDEDSTPNKRSARVSPPSTTPPSNTNTMNKRPLPNPHSYISGTNARNAGSVRTRGVPMLSAEMVEMMKKEGLGLEGVDLNELGGLDLDQLGELGIGLGFGDDGVGAGSGSGSVKGIRGGTKSAGASLRLRPKRKSASGQGTPSTMPIGSQSLRIRTRTAPSMTTKIRDDDGDDNGAMPVPMLPSNHPNFPNGLPVYSSASEGEPALELGLGGSIRKRKELQEQEGTMGRAGGRKSLSRVMARELVSKSKKMMMEQDNNPLPPLPHSPSSSSCIKVKGMVQTFERSTSFDEGQVGDDTQDQGDAKREDKEGRKSRILEDMKALREMARVRRERSGSTSSLSSTHSDSTHSESDSGSSVGSGARDNDNEDVFLSSPVEDKVGEGLGL